jgi:putative mycofactocin binding protein MftB
MTMTMSALDLEASWRLHPQVALRPEPFGALLYHFGTRKLSFLKNKTLLEIVRALPDPTYARALATLADSHMIVSAPKEP